jgi:ATP-dependent Clp protease ATP-binding subunit ClpB
MSEIVKIQLNHLEALLKEQNIRLAVKDDALALLSEKGYDPAFGARPLKRVVQRDIQNNLATMILSGNACSGDKLLITTAQGNIIIKKSLEV